MLKNRGSRIEPWFFLILTFFLYWIVNSESSEERETWEVQEILQKQLIWQVDMAFPKAMEISVKALENKTAMVYGWDRGKIFLFRKA